MWRNKSRHESDVQVGAGITVRVADKGKGKTCLLFHKSFWDDSMLKILLL